MQSSYRDFIFILVINKVDTVDKDEILKAIDTYRKLYDFDEIIPCSALRNQNTEDIIPSILKYLPYGPMFYDEDTVTDQPQRQIAEARFSATGRGIRSARKLSVKKHCMHLMLRFLTESPLPLTE